MIQINRINKSSDFYSLNKGAVLMVSGGTYTIKRRDEETTELFRQEGRDVTTLRIRTFDLDGRGGIIPRRYISEYTKGCEI